MSFLFSYLLAFVLLVGVAGASDAADNTPPIFSEHITVVDNGNPMRLRWEQGDVPLEGQQQVILFVPGAVDDATASVASFAWIANPTRTLQGDQRDFTEAMPDAIAPSVTVEEMGLLGGTRLAVLTLRMGFRDADNASVWFPRGEIEITFTQEDEAGTSRLGRFVQPVVDAYILNESRTLIPPHVYRGPPPFALVHERELDVAVKRVRVWSRGGGMVAIPGGELIEAFEHAPQVEDLLGSQGLFINSLVTFDADGAVKRSGELEATDTVWFHQPKSTSPYSPDALTWIYLRGPSLDGTRSAEPIALADENAADAVEAVTHRRLEDDTVFIRGRDTNERQNDFWMWSALASEEAFVVDVPALDHAGARLSALEMTLAVDPEGIQVATDSLTVSLDGQTLPVEIESRNEGVRHVSVLLPAEVPSSSTNTLSITYSSRNASRQNAAVYLDSVTASYRAAMAPQREAWQLAERQSVQVPEGALAFVVKPYAQLGYATGGASVQAEDASAPFFLVDQPHSIPYTLEPHFGDAVEQIHEMDQADLIVIAPAMFHAELRTYCDALAGFGIQARLLDAQALYDRFGDGRMDPHAIKRAISFAYRYWDAPAASAVLLVGDASWDTWGRYDSPAQNLLPGYRGDPRFAVENWFVQLDSEDDEVPEMMIGRWAVRTTEELGRVIERSLRYRESLPDASAANRVFVLTDHGFDRYTEELDPLWIPDTFQKVRRHIADYPLIDNIYIPSRLRAELRAKTSLEATEDTVSILNDGVMLWTFYGHGAPNVIGNERIFFGGGSRFSDVKKLTNQKNPFVVWSFSCETTSFDYPREKWYVSIGEDLLTHPGSGCVALFGATGRGYPHDHIWLSRGMTDAAFRVGLPMLGQHSFAGNLVGLSQQVPFEPKDQFALLGDPTLSFAWFEALSGSLESTDDELRFRWDVPVAFRDAEAATVWVQGERDALWSETVAVGAEIRGAWPREGSAKDTPQSVGVQIVAMVDGQRTIAHGSVAVPKPPAPPVIESVTGTRPDLAFVAGSVVTSPENPRDGETVFIDARIENRGSATAETIEVRGYYKRDGQDTPLTRVVGNPLQTIERLDPRQSETVRLRWDPHQNAGEHELLIAIDDNERIIESNEENNQATVEVAVRTKSDLVVDAANFVLSPRLDAPGFRMEFEIRNDGESTAERIVVEMIAKVSSQDEPVSVRPEAMYTERLDADESRAMRGINLPATLEWVEIVVDPDELVDESTHENNRFRFDVSEQ